VPDSHIAGGGQLFALAARLLGGDPAAGAMLGRAWAVGEPPAGPSPAPLRLLHGLARLAARDAARARAGAPREARGSLPRQWMLLKSVAFGR
jgi:hypothetical protein